ncbi:MAG: DUF3761 domain-containing protein [Bacteroidales bacterium]|nr:DUF3761 domain-containing protein [Bacteroidales bacterium]
MRRFLLLLVVLFLAVATAFAQGKTQVNTLNKSTNNLTQTVTVQQDYNQQVGKQHTPSSSTKTTSTQKVKYYTNVDGERVQSPTNYATPPAGATALCKDGTYSFSKNRCGTCSHHGGVAKWLK